MSQQDSPSNTNSGGMSKKPLLSLPPQSQPRTSYPGSQRYSTVYPGQMAFRAPPMVMPQLQQQQTKNSGDQSSHIQQTSTTAYPIMTMPGRAPGTGLVDKSSSPSLQKTPLLPRPPSSLPPPPTSLPPPPTSLPPPPTSLPPPPTALPAPPTALPAPPTSSLSSSPTMKMPEAKLSKPFLLPPKMSPQTEQDADGKSNGLLKRPNKSMMIKMNLSTTASKLTATKRPAEKKTVAEVFNGDDESDEEEDMPPEAKMRMRNIGKDTPTPSGPNSFNKTKLGFCNTARIFEKQLESAFDDKGTAGSGGKKKFK